MLATFLGNKELSSKSFSVVEIIIAVFIIVTSLVSFLSIVAFSLKSSTLTKQSNTANFLAQETIEAVRSFRDATTWDSDGLGILNTGTDYYPILTETTPPSWVLLLGSETINGFIRKVVFERVSRDPITKDIETTYNSANDDLDTRKAVAKVLWGGKEVKIITYFTNWKQ